MTVVTDIMLKEEFTKAFQRVWETAVGLNIQELKEQPPILPEEEWVAGVVWIGGGWKGCVTLAFPKSLAKIITARMLEKNTTEIYEEQFGDAIKELTNMCAGNLKSSLPPPTGLGTPGLFNVNEITDIRNQFSIILSLNFMSENHKFIAELQDLDHVPSRTVHYN